MNQAVFTDIAIYFALYSFTGWLCEEVYCSIIFKKLVTRGFLHGPYCPIYGFGALIVLFALTPFKPYPLLLFLCAMAATTVLEYFASWLMEKVFGLRWWDYSHMRFNLNGRVCLLNSVIFGAMGMATVYGIHPLFEKLVGFIPENIERFISSLFILVFLADFVVTLSNLADLHGHLAKLKDELGEAAKYIKDISWTVRGNVEDSITRLNALLADGGRPAVTQAVAERISAIVERTAKRTRLLDAFPTMRSRADQFSLDSLRALVARSEVTWKERRAAFIEKAEAFRQSQLYAAKRPEKAVSARNVEGKKSFAAGVNFYKLCWVFLIACLLGFFVETVYCIVTTGRIESRQGMLYGPLNQVYGFGAVLMVLALHPLAKYKDRWLFIGSALIGGVFEWMCSFIQEYMFGTNSWDYSNERMSIGGRTSLLYMVFWGILGLFFIRMVYPPLSRLIERIPNLQGKFLTIVITVILCANMSLSAAAVYRWAKRDAGIPPQSAAAEFIDRAYPDSFMKTVYPNMNMVYRS